MSFPTLSNTLRTVRLALLCTFVLAVAVSDLDAQGGGGGKLKIKNKSEKDRVLVSVTFKKGSVTETIEVNETVKAGKCVEVQSSQSTKPKLTAIKWKGPASFAARGPGGALETTIQFVNPDGTEVSDDLTFTLMEGAGTNLRYALSGADLAAAIPVPENTIIFISGGIDTAGHFPPTVVFLDDSAGLPYTGSAISQGEYRSALMWAGLGGGKPGTGGVQPLLDGNGDFMSFGSVSIDLSAAPANSPAVLIVGFGELNMPLLGGTLVPTPDVTLTVFTDASGNFSLPLVLPQLVPNLSVYFQVWPFDPGATHGLSATDGLQAIAFE